MTAAELSADNAAVDIATVDIVMADVDAIAAAVRTCPGVDDLDAGHPAEVATYLPGRRVAGVRIADSTVEIQIRARWGRPLPDIAAEVQDAVAPLAGGRRVDVLIADVAGLPNDAPAADPSEPVIPSEPVMQSEPVMPSASEPLKDNAGEPVKGSEEQ